MTNDELMKERMKIWDWFSVNMIWLKKYVDADSNTSWGDDDTQMVTEIKSLIENGPQVDEKFILDLIGLIAGIRITEWHPDYLNIVVRSVTRKLEEAGVSVEDKQTATINDANRIREGK